jgi:hypothetical protein
MQPHVREALPGNIELLLGQVDPLTGVPLLQVAEVPAGATCDVEQRGRARAARWMRSSIAAASPS